jgi:hypothetical protein
MDMYKRNTMEIRKGVRMITATENLNPHEDINFPFMLLSKIIFGTKTSADDIKKIKKIVEERYNNLKIIFEQMYFCDETQILKSKKIDIIKESTLLEGGLELPL